MRIDSAKTQQYLQKYKNPQHTNADNKTTKSKSSADTVQMSKKPIEHYKIAENSPDDPRVSTKVLDSLNMGMINFNQKERDVLATIMSEKAKKIDPSKTT